MWINVKCDKDSSTLSLRNCLSQPQTELLSTILTNRRHARALYYYIYRRFYLSAAAFRRESDSLMIYRPGSFSESAHSAFFAKQMEWIEMLLKFGRVGGDISTLSLYLSK